MLHSRIRRPLSLGLVASLVVSTTLALLASQSTTVSARAGATKYPVCHRTSSVKNPYRLINVAWNSVKPGTGHDNTSHDGPVFNYATPTRAANPNWGDIFYAEKSQGNVVSQSNWTTAGQLIMNSATFTVDGKVKRVCGAMSASEFIKSEKEADPARSMSSIMAELDAQGASEDAALLQSLNGTFTTWYNTNGGGSEDPNLVSSLIATESPSVTTEPPTNVAATTATLNGTVAAKGASVKWYFEWGTSSTLVSPNETTLSATAITTSQSVTTNITGLTSGTTYYYRTIGVAATGTVGTDSYVETILQGSIKQFVFGAPAAPTITSLVCGNTKITVNFTANANVNNVTGYEYSLNGGTYVSSGLSSSASGNFDITGLTNGESVDVVIRAITSSLKGIDSAAQTGSACGAPTPVTSAATNILQTSATLNGTVTANGATTTVTITWGTDSQLVNNSPTTTNATPNSIAPAEVLPVSLNLTGLTGGVTYYYKVNASSSGGSGSGSILSFTTPTVQLPATTTTAASSVTTTSATLNGTGTSNGVASNVVFKWGTDSLLASGTTDSNAAQNPLATSASGTTVSVALTNLLPYTTYYYRTIITNTNGTTQGAILNFTTLPILPVATTEAATSVTETTATINGTGDPNLFVSDIEFKWGTSSTLASGTTTTPALESQLAAGNSAVPVTLNLTGLTGGTTYYFQVTISNANGSHSGSILSFTTLTPIAPSSGSTTTTSPPPTPTNAPTTTTAPSPTVAPTTTAPPTTAVTAGTNDIGRVIGTAWFDTNKNNKRENNEPLLVGVPIELLPTGVTAKASGKVQTTAMSLVTTSDGSFDFTSVVPGGYRILAKLPPGYGIDQSWDSTGNNDWSVGVSVVATKVSRGDFAAIGTAAMSGCYSGQTVARELSATWDGFDKKIGTVDDATFTSKISDDCNFAVQGVPTGKFAVNAVTDEGKVVSAATIAVTPEGGTVKTASLSVKAEIQKVLPQTGSRQMSDLMVLAMYSIAAGAAIVVTSRRRRRL